MSGADQGRQQGGGGDGGNGGGRRGVRRRRGGDGGDDSGNKVGGSGGDDVIHELITTGASFVVPATDAHAAGIAYLLVPINALSDGAKKLDDLNQGNKLSAWTYSALFNWILESFDDLGLVGQKVKNDPATRACFGKLGTPRVGKPNELGTNNPADAFFPHHYANRQRVLQAQQAQQPQNRGAASGSGSNRGFAGGRDPGLHPAEQQPALQQAPQPQPPTAAAGELPPAYTPTPEAAPAIPPAYTATAPHVFGTVLNQAMEGDEGEVVRVEQAAPAQPPPQQQAGNQNQGPPEYIHSSYFIKNEGTANAPGYALVPKIRTSVLPLYTQVPVENTPVMECSDPGKNLRGYLITFVRLDPTFDMSEFLTLFIKKVQRRNEKSMEDHIELISREKLSVQHRSAKNMRYTGDLTQHNVGGPKIKNIKPVSSNSPDTFIRSAKHAHELLYVNYINTLKMLIEELNPELRHVRDTQEYIDHWNKPKNAFSQFTDEKNETLDISILRNWKFLEACLRMMKVSEEQIPDNPWPQSGDYHYPETVLGFTVPAQFTRALHKFIFPSKSLMRFVMGTSKQALVKDVKRLNDPTMADLEILTKETNISADTMPRKGELAELYLPHEQIANYHHLSVLAAKRASMKKEPGAHYAMRDCLKAIIQDNEIKVNDHNIPNSRHVKNCNEYFHLLKAKNLRMVESHPIAEGYGFVGQYLIYLGTKLSELGVDRSQHVVLLMFLSGCSPIAMGYFDFAKVVALSFMLCGHPSTGKSYALSAACQLMVPGSFEEFQNTTTAGIKSFGKELDMVAHMVSEAQKVLTEPLKNLKGDEVETRRLIQTILSEQSVFNKKCQTVYLPNGDQRDVPYNEQVIIRTVISGAKNQISTVNEINADPLFSRCIQVNMACLTAELTDPQRPPLDRIDPMMGNHLTEFTRKIQCISVLMWTRLISSKLIPKPSTKLYYLFNDRIKKCPLFIQKPDRNISSLSIMYSIIVVQAAAFFFFGNLSPLLSHRFPKEMTTEEFKKLADMPVQVVAELLEEVQQPFFQELLVMLAGHMNDNREAAVAVLSFAYLWDMPVMFMLSQLMAAKMNAHGEFIRRCVQLRDRKLSADGQVIQGARIDSALVSPDTMSHLYSWKEKKNFAANIDLARYFYSEEDDDQFLNKLYSLSQNRMTPNGNTAITFEPGTQEFRDAKMATISKIVTYFNSILYALHDPKHMRRLVCGGIQQAKDSRDFLEMSKLLSLENEVDFSLANIQDVNEKIGGLRRIEDVTFEACTILHRLYVTFFDNLHYFREAQNLINEEELKELINNIDDPKSLRTALVALQAKKLKFKELHTLEQNKDLSNKAGGGSANYFGKMYLPKTADETIPNNKMPKFKVEANGMINPNYIEFRYGTDMCLWTLVHNMITTANHKLKELNSKEVYYYLDSITQIKMKHPNMPLIDASHFKNMKADFIGSLFDPANLATYATHESPVLFYENSKSRFSNEEGEVPVFVGDPNSHATYLATDTASGASGTSSSMGSDGRINQGAGGGGSAHGNAGADRNQGRQGNGGGASGSADFAEKKAKKQNKAYLLTHYFMMDQQFFFDKFMQTLGSENTTEKIPVIGIFPSRKDVRMYATSETRKGEAPTSFANPGFRNPKFKKASKGRASYNTGPTGETKVDPLFDPPFNDKMDNLRIDMGVQDEETEFNDAFSKEWGFGKTEYPEYIRKMYMHWSATVPAVNKVLLYPKDYGRIADNTDYQ